MIADPQISIALASYNGEKYIGEQLRSISNQTYAPTEIIVCDDVSSDDTVSIIKEHQSLFFDRIYLYRNDVNLGFIKNFEKAILLCKGDIIVLSDQDDVWLPTRLEHIVNTFTNCPECGLIFTDATVTNESLVPLGYTVYARHHKSDALSHTTIEGLLKKTSIKGCTIAFRRDFCRYLFPITSPRWGHDHWIAFIVGAISKICMVEEPLMFYRRHSSSAGNDPFLDYRYSRMLQQIRHNLSTGAYQQEYDIWNDMLCHLILLRSQTHTDFSVEKLEEGIQKTRSRVEFAEKRLSIRKKNACCAFNPFLIFFGMDTITSMGGVSGLY